jgi:methylamine dehydrogenase heavy chain
MRTFRLTALTLQLTAAAALAGEPIPGETPGRTVLPGPQPGWFIASDWSAGYVFDAADGEMKGLITRTEYTTGIVTLPSRMEAYQVDSYYSRRVSGDRSDVLTVLDLAQLAPKAEIELPPKTATLPIRGHIGLLNDERHVVVFNMTPAQSVSIVNVVDRKFAGEISTAGCAIILPVELRSFLMICGDGTLQLIELDAQGREARRVRSQPFFDVERDPVFGSGLYTGSGWLLVSHDGLVREVRAPGGRIEIGEAWSMLNDEDRAEANAREQWRPGGEQPFTLHRGTSLLYALMHKGGIDTHRHDGQEVWVFDTGRKRRVARLRLPVEAGHIHASQETAPRLVLADKDGKLHIYDGLRMTLQRTIEEPGTMAGPMLQALAPHD